MKTYVHFWPRSDWVENSKAAFIITVMWLPGKSLATDPHEGILCGYIIPNVFGFGICNEVCHERSFPVKF
jgi:hypothetical protein